MRYTNSLALACAMGLCGLSSAHATDKQTDPGNIPAVTDWSSRSVVYSKPMTPDEFAAAGRNADMGRLYNDPRYLAQLLRRIDAEMPAPAAPRTNTLQPGAGSAVAATAKATLAPCPTKRGPDPRSWHCTDTPQAPDSSVVRDWSNVLGGGTNGQGGRGMEGVYPAKYRFDITQPVSAANCPTDFIVYPTNAAGATQVNGTQESWTVTFAGNQSPSNGRTVTLGPAGPRQVQLTATNTSGQNSDKNFYAGGSNASTKATNLANAVNRWSSQTGFYATTNTGTVTIYSRTLGNITDGNVTTSNLDNVTFAHGNGSGTAGQPTIIAFNQLYNGTCTTATGRDAADDAKAPNVMWSYNTGAGYVVETSPVLSWHDDAKQVAFIQRNGNTLQLVLLKPAALTTSAARLAAAANPTAITSSSATAYAAARSGSAAAMTAITLFGITNTGSTPTYSSPFVDYAKDELYVGDGNGQLHKFTGVFKGTPAEVTSGGFPAPVASGMKLSAPVYYNGNVYIGSQSGAGDLGGKLHRVSSTDGTKYDSVKLANVDSTGLRESVIVTGTPAGSGSVFAFLFNDGTAGDTTNCAPDTTTGGDQSACRVVARFTPGFAAGAQPAQRAYVGRGNSRVSSLYAGAFDDAYYNSSNGTGAMYIVGGDPLTTFNPTLWKILLTNGVMSSQVKGPVVGANCNNVNNDCLTGVWNWSPVTYAKQGGNEYIYFSMPYLGNQTGCNGACLYMFPLTQLVPGLPGTHEVWTLNIARGSGSNNTRQGIPGSNRGDIWVGGTQVSFDSTGYRSADRTALIGAINALSNGYTAATLSLGCSNSNTTDCTLTITRDALGDVAGDDTSTVHSTLTNVTVTNATGTDPTSDSFTPIAWSTSNTPGAALQTPGGTGGIVLDNNSTTAPGAAQIYFTQQAAGGNAVQASQSGLE